MNPDNLGNKQNLDEEGSIEELKKDLYSRQSRFFATDHELPSLRKHQLEVAEDWQSEELPKPKHMFKNPTTRLSFLKKLLLVSVVFLSALSGFLFLFFLVVLT